MITYQRNQIIFHRTKYKGNNPKEPIMNKRQVIASLNKIANELDTNGLYSEATSLTKIMKKLALDRFRDNENFDEMFGDMDDEDNESFNPNQFMTMVNALTEIFMPYGDEDNIVEKRMEDYNVDPEQPSYENLQEVFRDLDDIIEDPRSNIFREQKVKLNDKMVNYDQLKAMMMNEAGMI